MADLSEEIPVDKLVHPEPISLTPEELDFLVSGKQSTELHVLVAGMPRNGKSTGLNNIFDLHLPAELSAKPVTDEVMSNTVSKNDISITVYDTPGLKSANANQDKVVMRDIKNVGLKNNFLLIVTLSVSASSCITQDYCNILKNLTAIFGKEIWNWSLVLLTYSDTIRNNFPTDQDSQKYLDYLKDHCTELEKVLQKIGVTKKVRPFFEYITLKQYTDEKLEGIVAIPVSKDPKYSTQKLLPQQPWSHTYSWTNLAFLEILKVGKNIKDITSIQATLIRLRYGHLLIKDRTETIVKAGVGGAVGGAVAGGAAGAAVGGGVGVIGGPVGVGVGMAAGAAAGVLAGAGFGGLGVGGGAAGAILIKVLKLIEQERIEQSRPQQSIEN